MAWCQAITRANADQNLCGYMVPLVQAMACGRFVTKQNNWTKTIINCTQKIAMKFYGNFDFNIFIQDNALEKHL